MANGEVAFNRHGNGDEDGAHSANVSKSESHGKNVDEEIFSIPRWHGG